MRNGIRKLAPLALLSLSGCAVSPEACYNIAGLKAEWFDQYAADKRACEPWEGRIVIERRVGRRRPGPGSRHHCRYTPD